MKRGKLIVFYGINNLGKSTQAKLLVARLNSEGKSAQYIKYPVYDLKPSGPIINAYLREGNPYKLAAREAQILYAYNRMHFEPKLIESWENGTHVITEDYWGTGVAWGVGAGVDLDFLLMINKPFQWEDLALLFVGKRFDSGKEKGHLHEDDDAFMEKVRKTHDNLGERFGWKNIHANGTIEQIAQDIWKEVGGIIK